MSYAVAILRRAQKQLEKLPAQEYPRIRNAIRELGREPRPPGCRKLVAREGWRLRIGDYRVIYEIDDTARTVTVLDIGNRRDMYR